jgi:hypothetical protein
MFLDRGAGGRRWQWIIGTLIVVLVSALPSSC